jgi:hypothetical protein
MSESNTKSDETKSSDSSTIPEAKWTIDHEKIFIEWADKAMCYRWLHSRSHEWYSYMNALYTIPVIALSTITGTANFAQTRVPDAYQNYYAMIVGALNITAGIITTVQQFLKITQLNEAHRVSSIAWDKFYRNIKIELAKHPDERTPIFQMLKLSKEEFDRLMETSPDIPDYVIAEFKKTFKDMLEPTDIKKMIFQPEICDKLVPTSESINQWNDASRMFSEIEAGKNKITEIEKEKTLEDNKVIVQEWSNLFKTHNKRLPTDEEIIDQLKTKIDIKVLKNIIQQIDGSNKV